MMYRWLPTAEECNIPPFAHTMIGVGAVVMNDAQEILVVKEKYSVIPHWKLPGGYIEPGKSPRDLLFRGVTQICSSVSSFD
jgi:ADP-ribose pyrophosphatase YjhB (NUDIX family)